MCISLYKCALACMHVGGCAQLCRIDRGVSAGACVHAWLCVSVRGCEQYIFQHLSVSNLCNSV